MIIIIFVFAGKDRYSTTNVDEDPTVSNKTALLKKRYSISNIKCFGVQLTPDTIAVAMVYFVQGVLGLARIAVNFYLKDDLHLEPAEVIISTMCVNLLSRIKITYFGAYKILRGNTFECYFSISLFLRLAWTFI